ncbi:MAG: glutathione peroxidase [Bdellovibrionota bacterium]
MNQSAKNWKRPCRLNRDFFLGWIVSLFFGIGFGIGNVQANVLEFIVNDISGNPQLLSQYKGKVLLIVNVASQCGYTYQYAGLEQLYKTYKERGFEILAFPSNDFLGQEPGTNEKILNFVQDEFKVDFPMFAKISVKGEKKEPLYRYLTESKEHSFAKPISWNFNKYLINRKGNVVGRYGQRVEPMSPDIVSQIEKLLIEKP